MLVDNITLQIKAGNGGNGSASFLRNGQTARGGPNGGNGGNGGDIYFLGSTNVLDLREFRFKKKIVAEDGIAGKQRNLFGKNAEHITVLVPLGTRITDTSNGNVYEIINTTTPILLAKGGVGGKGNTAFKSATNQTPQYAETGTPGEKKELLLELRLIAEIGLIGFPNAGKSSLLASLTNAQPKIGDYPFTTLEPNIGMLGNHAIADIPGLIEGGSKGEGLGISFLKHIEKTKVLLHCIDGSSKSIEKDYQTVRNEFALYNPELLEKPEVILITKADLLTKDEIKGKVGILKQHSKNVLACSIDDKESIRKVKTIAENLLLG